MRFVERRDKRLHHAHGAVKGARITPGFQIVGFGNVPVAILCRFVKMRADINDGLNFFLSEFFVKAQLAREIKIVRRRVHGIDADNDECGDLAVLGVCAKLTQRFQVIDGMRFDGLRVI